MSASLMTSTEVARLLGVTAGTVKRWADDGLLKCERTAGRHRRFASDAVDRFRRAQSGSDDPASPFLERLLSEADVHVIQADLLAERARRGAWWRVAEWLGAELDALGRRWAEGRVGILEEHLASERLSRALSRCGEALPPRTGAPTVLLPLGLSLVDLCLREAGFATAWAGRRTPAAELVRTAGVGAFDAVALSASVVS
ncbi:MAG: helix-turn-helix domain-containing protein, partial [Syntrophomonadaceae bacterium]